jgi:RHS repeat-associated protein
LVRPAWGGGGGGGGGAPPTYPAYFIHSDHLGSTVMLTCYHQSSCADGAVVRYDAYGRTRAYDAAGNFVYTPFALTDRLYTGQVLDHWAGLYNYGARFYDPPLKNFLTEDPVHHGVNPYAYVNWNPVMFTDPTGMDLIPSMAFTFNLYAGYGMADLYKGRHGLTDIGIGTGGGKGGGGGLALEMQAGKMNGQRYSQGAVLFAAGAGAAAGATPEGTGESTSTTGDGEPPAAPATASSPAGPGVASSSARALGGVRVMAMTFLTNMPMARTAPTAPGMTADNFGTFMSLSVAGFSISGTGGVLAYYGVADVLHVGTAVGQALSGGSVFSAGVIGFLGTSDSLLMMTGGAALTATGGFIMGAAFNDYVLAPTFGTPTVGASAAYLYNLYFH